MPKFGFVGPTYAHQSPNIAAERCINFYPEAVETGSAKTKLALIYTPGLKVFAQLPGMKNIRAEFTFNGRAFCVAEDGALQHLFEVLSSGAVLDRGTLGAAGATASLAANNANQLAVASAGRLFIFDLTANVMLPEVDTTTLAAVQGPVLGVGFSDSYFIVLLTGSRFQISALLDGTSWDPLDIAQVEAFPDALLSGIIDHREIILWGAKAMVVYYDSGNPLFPFETIPGSYSEAGIGAVLSPVKADQSVFWMEADERGNCIFRRLQGYTPARVSNHAVEAIWRTYATVADLETYSFSLDGHILIHLYFPTANASWRYDIATGLWHEPLALDGTAHRSRCHMFCFGKHLVGDPKSGTIYEMSPAYLDDAGTPIRRVRRGPQIYSEGQRIPIDKFQVDVETGLGPQPNLLDGQGNPRGPHMGFRYSSDGGHTWSQERTADCGKAGEFLKRVIFRRLGSPRSFIPEISMSDPIPWRIAEAYINNPD